MKTGLESLDTGAPEITYSGNQGPKSPQKMQMAMADSLLEDEYKKYVFEMEEQGLEPMSIREFIEQALAEAREGVKDGGMMRTAFQGGGRDAGAGSNFGSENFGGASNRGNGDNRREQYSVAQTQNIAPTTIASVDRSAVGPFSQYGRNVMNQNLDSLRPTVLEQAIDLYKNVSPTGILINLLSNIKNKKISPSINDDDDDNNFRDGDGQQIIFPNTMAQVTEPIITDLDETDLDTDTDTTDFVSRFGRPSSLPFADYRGGIEVPAADGGRIGFENGGDTYEIKIKELMDQGLSRELAEVIVDSGISKEMFTIPEKKAMGGRIGYAGGGITDLRQGYFLGKLVKKATRAVKKIAKSPVGKAALAYALTGGLGNLAQGQGFFQNFRSPTSYLGGAKNIFRKKGLGNILLGGEKYSGLKSKNNLVPFSGLFGTGGKFDPFRAITAFSALPLLMPQDQEEDDLDKITGQAARGPSIQDVFGMNLNQIAKGAREGTLDPNIFNFLQSAADGGRIGLAAGGIGDLRGALSKEMFNLGEEDEDEIKKLALGGSAGLPPITMMPEGMDSMSFPDDESTGIAQATPTTTLPNQMPRPKPMMDPRMMQQMMMQQRMNPMMARGMMQQPRIMAQEGGMMDMGGMEKDYRNEGGFVPIGGQERADDVPARLSKNEFVFTADAVRNAGGGDIDKGAEIMENMMENLEAGGKVSEASQGLSGAREMFATQQRLGEVL